jgi:oxygen-independent coproporphyrinogen-3 oxidase
MLLMGLRLDEGVALWRLDALGYSDLDMKIRHLDEIGMVRKTEGRLIVTPAGRPLLNAVLRDLLA